MAETILIDTDVAIDYLRGVEYARNLITKLWDEDVAFLSVLSIYELYAGMRHKEKEATDAFISACAVEQVTSEVAKKAGDLRKEYSNKGTTLTAIDCIINATAIIRGHKIATRNTSHYPFSEILLKNKI